MRTSQAAAVSSITDLRCSSPIVPYNFNIGGPSTRTRTEELYASLLADPRRSGFWPRVDLVGISFPDGVVPRQWCLELLAGRGYRSPDDVLAEVTIPPGPLHCREYHPMDDQDYIVAKGWARAPIDVVLRSALILGKCSDEIYDSGRPSIWTNRALVRVVALYSMGDFYAD